MLLNSMLMLLASLFVPLDWIPAIFAFVSISCWLCALMPQLITNFRRKECDSLSLLFVVVWWAGDISNCLGSVLLNMRSTAILLR